MERFNSFSSDQIILTKRQASMIMASMLLFCLFVFIVGFFLGKRTIIDDFSSKVTKEALHDQIDFLLTTQSLESSQEEGEASVDIEPSYYGQVASDKQDIYQEIVKPAIIISDKIIMDTQAIPEDIPVRTLQVSATVEEAKIIENKIVDDKKSQYAQLIGFGTKKAAQDFVGRLKKHGVQVILKTIMSKTASGKQRVWYQAITPTYDTAQELQAQLTKIKRLEHIRDKDMKIVFIK